MLTAFASRVAQFSNGNLRKAILMLEACKVQRCLQPDTSYASPSQEYYCRCMPTRIHVVRINRFDDAYVMWSCLYFCRCLVSVHVHVYLYEHVHCIVCAATLSRMTKRWRLLTGKNSSKTWLVEFIKHHVYPYPTRKQHTHTQSK